MKQIFIDVDKLVFDNLKKKKLNEITDALEDKNVKEGDYVVFQHEEESIKGCIRKLKKYNSIHQAIEEKNLDTIDIGNMKEKYQFKVIYDYLGVPNNKSNLKYRVVDIDFYLEK